MAIWLHCVAKQRTASLYQGRTRFVPGTAPVCPRHRASQSVDVYWFSCQTQKYGTKIQPEAFLTEVFLNPPGVMDVRAFGSWTSAPKCLFFSRSLRASPKFYPRRPPAYPRARRISGPNTYSLGCFAVPEKCPESGPGVSRASRCLDTPFIRFLGVIFTPRSSSRGVST